MSVRWRLSVRRRRVAATTRALLLGRRAGRKYWVFVGVGRMFIWKCTAVEAAQGVAVLNEANPEAAMQFEGPHASMRDAKAALREVRQWHVFIDGDDDKESDWLERVSETTLHVMRTEWPTMQIYGPYANTGRLRVTLRDTLRERFT